MLNWHSRHRILGGIYGRPVVTANVILYWIGGMVLFNAARRPDAPRALWSIALPALTLAAIYLWLMLRGPLPRDRASGRAP